MLTDLTWLYSDLLVTPALLELGETSSLQLKTDWEVKWG